MKKLKHVVTSCYSKGKEYIKSEIDRNIFTIKYMISSYTDKYQSTMAINIYKDNNSIVSRVKPFIERHKMMLICIIFACAVISTFSISQSIMNEKINQLNSAHHIAMDDIENDLNVMTTNYNNAVNDLNVATDMYTSLYDEYEAYQMEVGYSSMQIYEIANKFMYVFETVPSESLLTLDDLIYMDTLSEKYDINPHIVSQLFYVESTYKTDAVNYTSGATGIGQFLSSTGRFVYNDLLGYSDSYIHSFHAKDTKLCIEMSLAYLNYLMDTYSYDLWQAMVFYSGGSYDYANTICNLTKQKLNISNLTYHYI